jgi:UDP-N-acetylmuramyl pentapeptide synthase
MDNKIELIGTRKSGQSLIASADLTDRFLSDVAEPGASAAIVSDPTRAMNSPSDLALLQTQDTLTALHKLAPSYRQLMPQRPLPLRQP